VTNTLNAYIFVEDPPGFGREGRAGLELLLGCEVDKNTLKNHHLRDWKILVRMTQSQ
jgi:hypothetical protein